MNDSQGQQIELTELGNVETRGDLAERIELAVGYLDLATPAAVMEWF